MKRSWLEENNYQNLSKETLREKTKTLGLSNSEKYLKDDLIDFIAAKKAEDPNTYPDELLLLSFDFPDRVFKNLAFPLILLEQPDFFQQIIDKYSMVKPMNDYVFPYYLKEAAEIPEQLQKSIVSDFSREGINFKCWLLDNPNLSDEILELAIELLVNDGDREEYLVSRRDYLNMILENPRTSARILNNLTRENIKDYAMDLIYYEKVSIRILLYLRYYQNDDISSTAAWRIRTKRYD